LQISHARRKANPDVPPPKAKLMAAYYEKLTTLFWVSENYLFHAFAWYKYYTLCKEYNRGMSEKMKSMQASAVLLAALCIPSTNHSGGSADKQHGISSTMEDDIVKQKMARMATLLGFHTRNPTREALLIEIRSKNIIAQVPQYLRDLYYLLEDNSDPLVMVEQAHPLLEDLKKELGSTTTTDSEEDNEDVEDTTLARYVKPLTSVLLLKLLVNLASAYHTVSTDHLKKLTAGLDMSFEHVEKAIVLFTQSKTLSVRIDHRAGCLRFGDAQLESDVMRSQLTVLSKQLEAVCRILKPPDQSKSLERRAKVYQEVRSNLVSEHEAILERKNFIEKRKETTERVAQDKVREEARIKAEKETARKAEEQNRVVREQRLREIEKQRDIQKELDNQEKKRFLVAMGKKADEITGEELAKIDTDALQKEHQEKINKKREESERKTRDAAKKLDYLVRAIRIEELPLIKKKYEEKTKKDRERNEADSLETAKKAKLQWEADVKDKAVLEEHGIFDYFAEFEEAVMVGRRAKHQELCIQADTDAELAAEKAKFDRARKRKSDESKRFAEEEAHRKEEEEQEKLEDQKRERDELKREREAKEDERRQAENKRMDDERKKSETTRAGPSKYTPPSRRGGGGEDRPNRFGDAGGSAYPGGGRYEGRSGGGDGGGGGGGRRNFSGDRDGGGGGGDGGGRRNFSGDRGGGDGGGGGGRQNFSGDRGGGDGGGGGRQNFSGDRGGGDGGGGGRQNFSGDRGGGGAPRSEDQGRWRK
jgi:translation initiation factor 3 subunit A